MFSSCAEGAATSLAKVGLLTSTATITENMSVIVKPGPTCALLRLAATLSLSLSTATKTRGAMDSQRRTDMRCTLVFIAGLSVSVLSAIAGPIEDQQTPPASRSVDRIPDTATAALGIVLAITILATAGRTGRRVTAPGPVMDADPRGMQHEWTHR